MESDNSVLLINVFVYMYFVFKVWIRSCGYEKIKVWCKYGFVYICSLKMFLVLYIICIIGCLLIMVEIFWKVYFNLNIDIRLIRVFVYFWDFW